MAATRTSLNLGDCRSSRQGPDRPGRPGNDGIRRRQSRARLATRHVDGACECRRPVGCAGRSAANSDETSDDARTRSGMGEVLGLSRLAREAIEPTRHGRPSGLAYEDACAARPEPAIIEVNGVAMHGRCAACDGAFAIALSVPDGAVVVIGTGTRGEIALRSVRDLSRRRRSS